MCYPSIARATAACSCSGERARSALNLKGSIGVASWRCSRCLGLKVGGGDVSLKLQWNKLLIISQEYGRLLFAEVAWLLVILCNLLLIIICWKWIWVEGEWLNKVFILWLYVLAICIPLLCSFNHIWMVVGSWKLFQRWGSSAFTSDLCT